MIVTKREFADLVGVALSTVSTWIARGQLNAPALLSDGRVDLEAAKRQLAERIDLAKSLGRAPSGLFARIEKSAPDDLHTSAADPQAKEEAAASASPLTIYADRISRARGDLLQIEIDRRELMRLVAQGRLTRSADFSKALTREVSLLIATIDGQLREWVMDILSAASADEALFALTARVSRLQDWLQC